MYRGCKSLQDDLQLLLLIVGKILYPKLEKTIMLQALGVNPFIFLESFLQFFVLHGQVINDLSEGVGVVLAKL